MTTSRSAKMTSSASARSSLGSIWRAFSLSLLLLLWCLVVGTTIVGGQAVPAVSSSTSSSSGKVAVLVVYAGESWPAWIHTFLVTAQFSGSLYDWIFILPREFSPPPLDFPTNVRKVDIGLDDLSRRMASVGLSFASLSAAEQEKQIDAVRHMILHDTYPLVEFKPCLATMFPEIVAGYSHWAYGDIDMLLGRMDKILSTAVISSADITSVTFGDPHIFYLRGQLAVHRNRDDINNFWKLCQQYSNMTGRIDQYELSGRKKWPFYYSDEGCYSDAVIKRTNASIVLSTSQYSDAFMARLELREAFMLGKSLLQCFEKPIKLGPDMASMKQLMLTDKYTVNSVAESQLQPLSTVRYKCIHKYWFDQKYETCLDILPPAADVIRRNGELFHFTDERRWNFNGSCREGSMYHFLNWKKVFYQHTTPPPPFDAHVLLITDTGFIPHRLSPVFNEVAYSKLITADQQMTFGRLRPDAISAPTVVGAAGAAVDPHTATAYCLSFSASLQHCTCHLRRNKMRIIDSSSVNRAEASATENRFAREKTNVTLIVAGWAFDFHGGDIHSLITAWKGPKILILGYTDPNHQPITSEAVNSFDSLTVVEVDLRCPHNYSSMAYDTAEEAAGLHPILPDNMMYNIGLDLALTEMVCIVPFGYHLHNFHNVKESISTLVAKQLQLKNTRNVAVVFQSYQRDHRHTAAEHSNWIPYPAEALHYGSEQSDRLKIEFDMALSDAKAPVPVFFYAPVEKIKVEEYLVEKSVMLPFAFNVSASPHGTGFVRFPEELSGSGCYGSLIIRILIGAGYQLQWMQKAFASYRYHHHAPKTTGAEKPSTAVVDLPTHADRHGCKNSHGNGNSTAMRQFMKQVNGYYVRTTAMRIYGFDAMNTRRPFAFILEKHQRDRISKRKTKETKTGKALNSKRVDLQLE